MTPIGAQTSQGGGAWIELRGDVAGVDACRLQTNRGTFVVGSEAACDLVVRDPLVAARAFVIKDDSSGGWVLEAMPGVRVFVNMELAKRIPLRLGDEITVGCHRFLFRGTAPAERPTRSEMSVDDVLGRLLTPPATPSGFVATLPSWGDRTRGRRAWGIGAVLAALILLPLLLPRDQVFEAVRPPMEVVVAEREIALPPDSIRPLTSVQRKTIEAIEDPSKPAEIVPPTLEAVKEMTSELSASKLAAVQAPAPVLDKTSPDAGPRLAALSVTPPSDQQVQVQREAQALARSAPVRRLAVEESTQPVVVAELAKFEGKTDQAMAQTDVSTRHAQEVARTRSAPQPTAVTARTTTAADLAAFKPSPLKFEEYKGSRIPVARVAETLSETALPEGTKGLVLDGKITENEAAIAWKSGRFKLHGPGNPPDADPATYCYVGSADHEGKKHLYIAFLCADPNTDQIVSNHRKNSTGEVDAAGIIGDDTLEIFLDVNNDRVDYNQLIVNAGGYYWAGYYATPTGMLENRFKPWPVNVKIKTSINKAQNNWACEIMIPFDQLGGIPPKGSRWAVNFCRNFRGQKADHQLQTWFLVYDKARNYHHPDLFGIFQW